MGIGERKQVQLILVSAEASVTGKWQESRPEGPKWGAWAEILRASGSRGYDQSQTQMSHERRFRIRFRFDKYPGANWFIRYQGKDYAVSNIEREDEKKFYWLLTGNAKSDV